MAVAGNDGIETRLDGSFAQTINAAKKYVVSSTLEQLHWNAEFVRGDLGEAVEDQQLLENPHCVLQGERVLQLRFAGTPLDSVPERTTGLTDRIKAKG